MCIIVKSCEIVFSLNITDIYTVHVNIILDLLITYKNASALQIRTRMSTSDIVFFVTNNNENTYPKGGALMQMYRVVPQTKKGT